MGCTSATCAKRTDAPVAVRPTRITQTEVDARNRCAPFPASQRAVRSKGRRRVDPPRRSAHTSAGLRRQSPAFCRRDLPIPCYPRRMADHSGIEWTEATWNPTVGCTKVSPGCDRCYAERITRRFPGTYPQGFALTLRPDALELPFRWRRPRAVFVNSMSDLFHADVPEEFLRQVFEVMSQCPHHTFQVLTKRAERLARLAPRLEWPSNVWMGVSVESPDYAWRIDYLRRVPAAVRFISAEPLIAPLPSLDLTGMHWLIAGGESQSGCRPARDEWFRDLRDQCNAAGIAFFLKQLGGHPSKRGGADARLDGVRWIESPVTRDCAARPGQSG
jgi:protein gp37